MELVTGRKAIDINRPRGQQCLIEWVSSCVCAVPVWRLILNHDIAVNIILYPG